MVTAPVAALSLGGTSAELARLALYVTVSASDGETPARHVTSDNPAMLVRNIFTWVIAFSLRVSIRRIIALLNEHFILQRSGRRPGSTGRKHFVARRPRRARAQSD